MENWRSIKGFEGLYEVSDLGNVKSLARAVYSNGKLHQRKSEKILKSHMNNNYAMVVLCKDGKIYPKTVHRLVAETFIPNPDNKPTVDHVDTNRSNNAVSNLRWVTYKENSNNILTRRHLSQSKVGHTYWGRKLTESERQKISNALKGRAFSDEHRQALSDSHRGKQLSEETKKKLSELCKGRVFSETTKQKISEKTMGRHKGDHWKIENGKRVWYSEK